MIKLTDVTKVYNEKTNPVFALAGVTLEIAKAEFVSLVGSSGSGKTTLLNILGVIDKPSSGIVLIDDVDITKMNEAELTQFRRKKIGIIFQFFNLMPTLTVFENVALPKLLSDKNAEGTDARVKELLDVVGLSHRATHKPFELSGGEMQRTAIARALMNNPDIIIADEPTGNLDSKNAEQILKLIRRLATEQKKTFIVATHSAEVAAVSDRVVTMRDGKITENDKRLAEI
jgi:putative ABC transport system ATP-binding protein